MKNIAALGALILAFTLQFSCMAAAQDAPAGACLLPTEEWCWPIAPLTYGDDCTCTTKDGEVQWGVVQ